MDPVQVQNLAKEEYGYLTTRGRVSGKPHRIEIWFGLKDSTAYLLAGGGLSSDWIKNLLANPHVQLSVGKNIFEATARVVARAEEVTSARTLLAAKYYSWKPGEPLNEWASTALPIAIDLLAT